ncbi:hypothetical protein AJ80_08289 [Polytolypa hystricis UAMH7299]|uniref:Uncharacterized protein n=1 Tax=Polytolypa hystricis (strain UAMH7299) TaxID=1447883 RepID=A0A2B7XAH6_POLH7|nr:hypothetical protein AJ80_08289 [Polytolypa hystricis UAMH7299]
MFFSHELSLRIHCRARITNSKQAGFAKCVPKLSLATKTHSRSQIARRTATVIAASACFCGYYSSCNRWWSRRPRSYNSFAPRVRPPALELPVMPEKIHVPKLPEMPEPISALELPTMLEEIPVPEPSRPLLAAIGAFWALKSSALRRLNVAPK